MFKVFVPRAGEFFKELSRRTMDNFRFTPGGRTWFSEFSDDAGGSGGLSLTAILTTLG